MDSFISGFYFWLLFWLLCSVIYFWDLYILLVVWAAFFFLLLSSIHCIDIPQSVHPFNCWWKYECFQFGANKNKVTMNICVQDLLWTSGPNFNSRAGICKQSLMWNRPQFSIIICLGVIFYVFILPLVYWAFWISEFIAFIKIGRFSAKYFFFSTFSFLGSSNYLYARPLDLMIDYWRPV